MTAQALHTQLGTTQPGTPQPGTTRPGTAQSAATATTRHAEFRGLKRLVAGYSALSLAALGAAYALRHDAGQVTATVWIRGGIVFLTSLLLYRFAAAAARGDGNAYLRLRIVSAVMFAAIVVIAAVPGALPTWMRVEQGACGLLMLGVIRLANGPRIRALFRR